MDKEVKMILLWKTIMNPMYEMKIFKNIDALNKFVTTELDGNEVTELKVVAGLIIEDRALEVQ